MMEVTFAATLAVTMLSCIVADTKYSNPVGPIYHPCERQCADDGEPMLCHYHWKLENYLILSRACYDCPSIHNQTDCMRPDCIAADGIQRGIRTINRQVPGPSIQVCEGDTIEVDVVNQMVNSEAVTIHWHGILQRKSPHMDGVAMVTQCPILAASHFTYRFLAEDPGTHLYHAHSGLFRADGIFGGIVVRQSPSRDLHSDLYDLDLPEHLVVLSDWPHRQVVDVYSSFFHGTGSQAPESILINGRGIFPPTRVQLLNNDTTPLAEFHVQAGQRYRFRMVAAGALRCPLEVSIDHHQLLLIASDGHPIEPLPVDSVVMFSGERYDIVLHANVDEVGVHWLRVRGHDLCEFENVQQFAILKYLDHVTQFPKESMDYDATNATVGVRFNKWLLKDKTKPHNETSDIDSSSIISSRNDHDSDNKTIPDEHELLMEMTSIEPDDVRLQKEADQKIYLEFAYRLRPNFHFHDPVLYPAFGEGIKTVSSTMINNISNILPPAPLLTQQEDINPDLLCNFTTMVDRNCSKEFCECFHRVVVQEGEVVEFIVYDSNDQEGYTHPLHLHGHSFRIVAVDTLKEKITLASLKEMDAKGEISRRLHAAPIKDTVPIPDGGYIILRIHANNPGTWFMHCHVALHAEIGMSLTLQVNNAEGQLPPPPSNFPRCGPWRGDASRDEIDVRALKGSKSTVGQSGGSGNQGSTQAWMAPVLASMTAACVVVVVASAFYMRKRQRVVYNRELRVCANKILTDRRNLSSVDDDAALSQCETSRLL